MNYQQAILHLSLVNGIGPGAIKNVIDRVSAKRWYDLYRLSLKDWKWIGIPPLLAQRIYQGLQNNEVLEKELLLMQDHGISYITLRDDRYPFYLKNLHLPPPVLYYKGALFEQERCIAFVGSRNADAYGKRIIEQLVPDLVAHHFSIVSGGAIGADSMAHCATLKARGRTIVVLGSGLLHLYPYKNKKLFEEIVTMGGMVLSPFALQVRPLPGNFVARNRIIAGLSEGVVVVQAAEKSGTRITAQFALEQGRDVFAVPGLIHDPLSAGCHALIQEGAKLVTQSDDILDEYGIPPQKHAIGNMVQQEQQEGSKKESITENIIAICFRPQSVDDIARHTGKNLKELQMILFEMQMNGQLEQDFSGLWYAV